MAAIVAALLCVAMSCQATGNTLARWGGAAGGAVAGGAVGGPIGAAVGAVAGDAGGDALVSDPPQTVNETRIENNGGTVHVAAMKSQPDPWYWDARWWLAAYLVFRFRAGLLAFVRTLITGGFSAAFVTLCGIVLGGKVADTAKEVVAEHEAKSPRALALRRLGRAQPRQKGTPK